MAKDYNPNTDFDDTTIYDDTDATYNYFGRAAREEVRAAGSLAAAQALGIWYISRTTKASPNVTETAASQYDQVWDDRGTITSWA